MKQRERIYAIIGSAFGAGYSPILPGSLAALFGVGFHVAVVLVFPVLWQRPLLVAGFLGVCTLNHVLSPWAEKYWNAKDPAQFVLDEIAGYLLVPILFRFGELYKVVLWGFILFRIFDIFKLIPPARYIDKNIPGAWGILLDDLVSAAYAALVLYILYRAGPAWLIKSA
jgi:phosphatidylglycerophosphatase A